MDNQARNLRHTSWLCLALGLLTLAVYLPLLTHDFLGYDDQQYVTENPHVQAGLTWHGLAWAFQGSHASNWHPLTWLSHMLDCQLYGLKPAGHHLTSLLLHVANTLLLFLALQRMTGAVWRSVLVAALFAWHPLHVESVAWVAERKDVLSAFFWMLTLHGYLQYAAKPGTARYLATLGLFALGLMSKPMIVTLPFVLLLLDFWPLRRTAPARLLANHKGAETSRFQPAPLKRLLAEKIPFLALTALACGVTLWAQQQGSSIASTQQLPLSRRLPHALVAYAHYLTAMLVPRHLSVYYPYPTATPMTEIVAAGMLLAFVSFLALRFARRWPHLPVGWFWYLGTLVPVIGLVQVGDQAWADRYGYLPLIGLFIPLVWGGFALAGDKIAARAIAIALGLALLTATSFQLRHWQNTQTLFEHATQVTRSNYLAATLLGSLRDKEGKLDEAMAFYALALRYKPDYSEAHFFLGHALEQQGKSAEAMAEYTAALRLNPQFEQAHILLGMGLARNQDYDAAAAHYQAALQTNPESAAAQNNLAKLLHTQGRLDEAIEHYTAALRIDPKLAQAHNNLGIVLLQKGRMAEGTAQLKEALQLNPDDLESQFNLAQALNQQGQGSEAAELFSKIARARPDDPNLHYQFGLALAQQQKTQQAMSQYAHALLLQPDFPDALNQLSWILATDPHPEFRNGAEAVRMAERACALTGQKQPLLLVTLAATYAEAGRFPEAIATIQTAQGLASSDGQKELALKCSSMLNSFQGNQPCRETAAPAR